MTVRRLVLAAATLAAAALPASSASALPVTYCTFTGVAYGTNAIVGSAAGVVTGSAVGVHQFACDVWQLRGGTWVMIESFQAPVAAGPAAVAAPLVYLTQYDTVVCTQENDGPYLACLDAVPLNG
jgi:hypothetical protein